MSFVATVEAQPWYPAVASIFAQAGVPQDVWLAEMKVESPKDANGAPIPNESWPDQGGISYGLFSLRQPGVGSGYSPMTLESPTGNASIAASTMAKLLASAGNPSGVGALQALSADWPGAWNPASADTQARIAALTSVDQQLGGSVPNPNAPLYSIPGNNPLGINSGLSTATNGFSSWIAGVGQWWSARPIALLAGALVAVIIGAALILGPAAEDTAKVAAVAA